MDYRRFISYLYNYVDGEKGVNVGYIRCEQRHGICRLTLNLQDRQGVEGGTYKVYLYKISKEGNPVGYYLDEFTLNRGCGEVRKQTNSENVWNSNHRIEEFDGVVAIYDRGHAYGSQWSDEPLQIERFHTYQEWQKQGVTSGIYIKESEGLALHAAERPQPVEEQVASIFDRQVYSAEPGTDRVQSNAVSAVPIGAQSIVRRQDSTTDSIGAQSIMPERDSTANPIGAQSIMPERDSTANPINTQSIMSERDSTADPIGAQSIVPERDSTANPGTVEENSITEQDIDGTSDPVAEQSSMSGQSASMSRSDIAEATLHLMEQRPKLPDFGNHEIYDCVRIEPNDIGLLAMDNWRLGVNSFLTHGYYNYKYLMLGKLRFQDGVVKAVLGVPGVYDNKEQYIAKIFGFELFVPVKHTNVKTGNFGYWISEIV